MNLKDVGPKKENRPAISPTCMPLYPGHLNSFRIPTFFLATSSETEMRVREDAAFLEDRRRRQNRADPRRPMRAVHDADDAGRARIRRDRDMTERKQR